MGEKAKRKQQMDKLKNRRQKDEDDLDELLSSIKAKVGIMEIYSK
jgi:ParB-like chromosome segregation protein Spo0J